jgi:hypothetical protein
VFHALLASHVLTLSVRDPPRRSSSHRLAITSWRWGSRSGRFEPRAQPLEILVDRNVVNVNSTESPGTPLGYSGLSWIAHTLTGGRSTACAGAHAGSYHPGRSRENRKWQLRTVELDYHRPLVGVDVDIRLGVADRLAPCTRRAPTELSRVRPLRGIDEQVERLIPRLERRLRQIAVVGSTKTSVARLSEDVRPPGYGEWSFSSALSPP